MGKLCVYVAAPWLHKADALVAQTQFEAAGFEVVSHWIQYHGDGANDAELQAQAVEDYAEIVAKTNAFVILNLALSEGKAFEFGVAYRQKLPCVVVGSRERNIFYHLPGVLQVETVEEAITVLRRIQR
mgnify:FL=1